MSGKKGMQHYPENIKEQIRQEYKAGAGLRSLERKYGIADMLYRVGADCAQR